MSESTFVTEATFSVACPIVTILLSLVVFFGSSKVDLTSAAASWFTVRLVLSCEFGLTDKSLRLLDRDDLELVPPFLFGVEFSLSFI